MARKEQDEDFLDEIIREGTERDADFPRLLAAAERSRALMKQLAAVRVGSGISQVEVARQMKTSQPAVARLEAGESDPRLSTVERYAGVVGQRLTTATWMSVVTRYELRGGGITVRTRVNDTIDVRLGSTVPAAASSTLPLQLVGDQHDVAGVRA
jgi:transcriptional regulator with XRE-family HTH domain